MGNEGNNGLQSKALSSFELRFPDLCILFIFESSLYLKQEMIDRALGLEPVARRKKNDNTSETSDKREKVETPVRATPVRSNLKSFNDNRSEEPNTTEVSSNRKSVPRARPSEQSPGRQFNPRLQSKDTEEVARSPVQPRVFSKPIIGPDQSIRIGSRITASTRLMTESKIKENQKQEKMYKLKMLVFMIISMFMIYLAMSPSRKVAYKKKS